MLYKLLCTRHYKLKLKKKNHSISLGVFCSLYSSIIIIILYTVLTYISLFINHWTITIELEKIWGKMTQSYWCNRNSIINIPTLHEDKLQTQRYEDCKWTTTTTTFFIPQHVLHSTIKLHYYIITLLLKHPRNNSRSLYTTTYYLFSYGCHYVK